MNSFNKFHNVLKPIALSNTQFYEKILGRYQKNKMITSRFPILFFFTGRKLEGSQKIDFNVRLFLELQNRYSSVLKRFENIMRNLTVAGTPILMLQPERTVLNLKVLQVENIKSVLDEGGGKCNGTYFPVRFSSSHLSVIPTDGSLLSMMNIPQKTRPLFKAAVPYILSGFGKTDYRAEVRAVKNLPEDEHPIKMINLFNAKEIFPKIISRKWEFINRNRPLLKLYPVLENHNKSDYNPAEGFALPEVYPPHSGKNKLFTTIAEDLYFLNQQQIGQEIQKVRETISGLEKAVSDKLKNATLSENERKKSAQEISIISEHVYQNIERRIRLEREMRGL